jgi:hypothetical protein
MQGQALKHALESMCDVVRDRCRGDEIVTICNVPGCNDRSGNRSTSLKTGKTSCWLCNVGGDWARVMRWLGYAIEDSGDVASSLEDLHALINTPKPKSFIPVISEIKLPNGFKPCYDNPDSVYTREIGKMAVRKNLEPDDLVNAGVGYTMDDGKWQPFAIFPVLEYERIVYYQGRTYWDDPGVSTKRFPSRQEAPLSSKYWIYNIDALQAKCVRTAVVVESILNVLSLQKKFDELGITDMVPICVFKHHVSKAQFYKILRYKHLDGICLLFDYDAIDLAWADAKDIDTRISVTIAEMPLSATNLKFDPNDDVNAAWVAIQNRKPYRLSEVAPRVVTTIEALYNAPPIQKEDWNKSISSRLSTILIGSSTA